MRRISLCCVVLFSVACSVGCAVQAGEQETGGMGGAAAEEQDLLTSEQEILGSNSCKSARITIRNRNWSSHVRVLKLEFYDLTSKKWRSEDVANTEIRFATGTHTFSEDLQYTKNHRIGNWKIKYQIKDLETWKPSQWRTVGPVEGYNRKCVSNAGTKYILEF